MLLANQQAWLAGSAKALSNMFIKNTIVPLTKSGDRLQITLLKFKTKTHCKYGDEVMLNV